MERGDGRELISYLCEKIAREGIDRNALIGKSESPIFEKYDGCIPGELLRRAYAEDRLRTDEVCRRLPEILDEYKN